MNQWQMETEAHQQGMDKFFNSEAKARRDGKADETAAGSSVLRQRVLEIGAALEESTRTKTRGVGGAYIQALRVAATRYDHRKEEFYQDYNVPAYIGLMTVLQCMYAKNSAAKHLAGLVHEIGRRLEYDQKQYVFAQDNPGFVAAIDKSLQQQGVTSTRHKIKTYQKKWRDADLLWEDWGMVKRAQVGLRVVRAIINVMPECIALTKRVPSGRRHSVLMLETTLEFDDWIISETDLISKTKPLRQPLIEPPNDWEKSDGKVEDGYHTPALRMVVPFIKTTGEAHQEYVDHAYPLQHINACNHLQKTAWKINQPVLEATKAYLKLGIDFGTLPMMQKIPTPVHPGVDATDSEIEGFMLDSKRIHGMNKQNASDMIVLSQSLQMAEELGQNDFYHVYTCDFRGRLYCASTMLSTQGADHIRGLLQFSEGKPLGREGVRWLAIHGANKFGYDKVDYDDRVRWVIDQRERIEAVVRDPTDSLSRSFIAAADKPIQFLAFCIAWAGAGFGTDSSYICHLPIGLDGSCNGLQHYAALLCDPVGGKSVNLFDSALPEDVYGDVAKEFHRLLLQEDDPMGKVFLDCGFDRKLTKRPVMTLPYGSTRQSCREYIQEYIADNALKFDCVDDDRKRWRLAVYATPIMWEAIGNSVVAARIAMAWLQECNTIIAREGVYARWLSPAGFPIYQHYSEYESVKVRTSLFGDTRITMNGASKGVAPMKARLGIAPNYIHGMDSSHEVLAINEAAGRGMTAMACVHDDYGTHACDIPEFNDVIRITFVRMYYGRNWLAVWRKEMERLSDRIKLPDPPDMGDLDLTEVLDARYFFG